MADYIEGVDFISTVDLRKEMKKSRKRRRSSQSLESRVEGGKRGWEKRRENFHNEQRHPVISHSMKENRKDE